MSGEGDNIDLGHYELYFTKGVTLERGEDWFEPVLKTNTHTYTTPHTHTHTHTTHTHTPYTHTHTHTPHLPTPVNTSCFIYPSSTLYPNKNCF